MKYRYRATLVFVGTFVALLSCKSERTKDFSKDLAEEEVALIEETLSAGKEKTYDNGVVKELRFESDDAIALHTFHENGVKATTTLTMAENPTHSEHMIYSATGSLTQVRKVNETEERSTKTFTNKGFLEEWREKRPFELLINGLGHPLTLDELIGGATLELTEKIKPHYQNNSAVNNEGLIQGLYVVGDRSGKPKYSAEFNQGYLSGKAQKLIDNDYETFFNGILHGKYQTSRHLKALLGTVLETGDYETGVLHGQLDFSISSKGIKGILQIEHGAVTGLAQLVWSGTGKPRETLTYNEHGLRDGPHVGYNKNGTKILERFYKNGILDGKYLQKTEQGVPQKICNFKMGKKHGECRTFYPSGNNKFSAHYKDGLVHGPVSFFYQNGKRELTAQLKHGKPTGTVTTYYENGQKHELFGFVDGVPAGALKSFYANGKVFIVGTIDKESGHVHIQKAYNKRGGTEPLHDDTAHNYERALAGIKNRFRKL